MIAALDIGNSRMKFAQFEGNKILRSQSCTIVEELFGAVNKEHITLLAYCSVNPTLEEELRRVLPSTLRIIKVEHHSAFSFSNMYNAPHSVGIDRLCGIEGALYLRRNETEWNSVITIDCGTATTINVLNERREFIGGVILPGIQTMMDSLHYSTAQLPLVDLNEAAPLIGSSTSECIRSGILNSTLTIIEKVRSRVAGSLANDPKIYLTGGNAELLSRRLSGTVAWEPFLNLYGVYCCARREQGDS
jgi:type III pantothenate kinase